MSKNAVSTGKDFLVFACAVVELRLSAA